MANNFIRDKQVDLSTYLPPFLLKDPEFAAKLSAESGEHDAVRLSLIDILNQLFISTATWGLERWEQFLAIPTDLLQTYDARRQKILRKMQGSQIVTLDFITKLVNLYVADGQAAVIDYPDKYSIEMLYHGGQVIDYEKLRSAISTYIPAHIGYKLVTITTADLLYHGTGTVQAYGKCIVDMTTDYTNTISDSSRYIAGIVAQNYKQISIMGGQY